MPRITPDLRLQRAFGLAIRERREALNISQEELGAKSKLHRTYISQLERGIKSPSLATIDQVAQALSATASVLIKEAEVLAGR